MSVSLSVSLVLCLSHSYTLCSLHICPVSLIPDTHFFLFRLFFASICCYMCPSTYLSHSYTQCLPYVSISLPISLCFLRHYVGIACVQLCSSVVSYACFHINSSTVVIILTQDCPYVVGVSMCCSRYDCKALLLTSLTHVSGAIANVQTFTFRTT